jgi:hypothetical protein
MALEQSILKSTKKIVGVADADDGFDLDLITNINNCFVSLLRLGIGPAEGFSIDGSDQEWADFLDDPSIHAVKTYVQLKVRSVFDPPGTPHHLSALNEQITELEHTLLTERNLALWATTTALP